MNITQETAQKIDYLIQGMADGNFDEVAKKIEFVKKLSGDHAPPQHFQELLKRIDELEQENHALKGKVRELEATVTNEVTDLQNDIRTVAKAIQWVMKPDPLASELYDVEQFLSKHGARKY